MDHLRSFRAAPVPTIQASPKIAAVAGPLRDLRNEPVLNLAAIQGDILLGHAKKAEALVFLTIQDPAVFAGFLQRLPITSCADVFRPDPGTAGSTAIATGMPPPNPRFGIALSISGLRKLDRDPGAGGLLEPLVETMAERAVAVLNDPDPATWTFGGPGEDVDGVLVITGAERADVDAALARLLVQPDADGYAVVGDAVTGEVRPGAAEGHEHFDFLDGVSQPGIRGCVDAAQTVPLTRNADPTEPDQGLAGQDLLWPGEFVLGYATQVAGPDFREKGDPVDLPQLWMADGSFLVVRRLTQLVPEMHDGVAAQTPAGQSASQLEAQLVGRWPNGAAVVDHPDADDPGLGTDPARNNDFEFDGDREGLTCPWGAHIRKAYPRNDVPFNLEPSGEEEKAAEAFTQTHRMLRRGIQFGPELTAEETASRRTTEERGLLFKCYVADIADQFEFVQQAWCNEEQFAHPDAGIDPIIGQAAGGAARPFLGVGTVRSKPAFTFEPWVRMTGGGYYFAPSLDFIRGLDASAQVPAPE